MTDELRDATWKDRLLCRLGLLSAFLVEGDSMVPLLKNGETVLISRKAPINAGDIALANHPYRSHLKLVKRIAAIESNGDLILLGDNPAESTDSRSFGAVSRDHLIGKVVCRLK